MNTPSYQTTGRFWLVFILTICVICACSGCGGNSSDDSADDPIASGYDVVCRPYPEFVGPVVNCLR